MKRETVFVYMVMGLSLAAAALAGTVPAIMGDPRRKSLDLHRRGRAFRLTRPGPGLPPLTHRAA